MAGQSTKLAVVVVLIFAVISVALGATFIYQGVSKNALIMKTMIAEKVTHPPSEEKELLKGIIDTPEEVQAMASVLNESRKRLYGYYSELDAKDPKREMILKGITMENSMNLALLGFGLCTVIIVTGVFMIIMGLALGTVAFIIRPRVNLVV